MLCHLGYVLDDGSNISKTITCRSDQTWDADFPNCTGRSCSEELIPFGQDCDIGICDYVIASQNHIVSVDSIQIATPGGAR